MIKLGGKSVCLWHAFNTLAGGDTRVVNKSKLKVLTHNIANCLGVLKIEEQMEQHFETKEVTFESYFAFIQSALLTNLEGSDLEKVDQVCWFVCCRDYIQRSTPLLSVDNMFVLWRTFNAVVDYDYDDNMPVTPVAADGEEIGIIAQKYCTSLGQTLDLADFQTLSAGIGKFSFCHVLNLWETRLSGNLQQDLVTNALKELQDEIVYEAVKKGQLTKKGHVVSSWKERWFVLSLTSIKYYTNATEKELKGELPITAVCKTELMSTSTSKGSKPYRFKLYSSGKSMEISASDMRTRSEWMAAINMAIESSKEMVETPQQLARKQRHLSREEKRRRDSEEEENRKQRDIEMESVKSAREAAEAKALNEEERRKSTILQLEAQRLAREEAEARALQEEERLRQEQQNLENTQGQLEAERQARVEAETRLVQEAALREAERCRTEELEALQKQLEDLLEQERQAKRDEEIVRNLQSKVLEEEFEKREELEGLKEQLQGLLKEEQERTAGLEELRSRQEERLEQEQERTAGLEELRSRQEERLEQEQERTAGLEELRSRQEERLKEEQERLQEMETKRGFLDQELQDAKTKLEEAEQAKIDLKENLKQKQREKPVFRLAPDLPDDGEFLIVTHRGHGAFCGADFDRSADSRNNSVSADHNDSGVSAEGSPVFERRSIHEEGLRGESGDDNAPGQGPDVIDS